MKGADMQEVFNKILSDMKNKSYERFGNEGMGGELVVNLDDAIEIVKQAAAEYNNGWIPCSERLPVINVSEDKNVKISYCEENRLIFPHDIGKRVLVTDDQGYVYESIFWINAKEFDKCSAIIAWKTLPDPYQPNGE